MWIIAHLREDESSNCVEVIDSFGPIYNFELAHQIMNKLVEECKNENDKYILSPLVEVLDKFFSESK